MKKNIERIQRWLDRLSSACEKNRWDSALIEADCLSAEVRKTREDIWNSVNCEQKDNRRVFGRSGMFMALRTASVALLIVFAASLPAAIEADRPLSTAANTVYVKDDRLSWVTPEEEALLLTLRSEMSKGDLIAARAAAGIQAREKVIPENTGHSLQKNVTPNKETKPVTSGKKAAANSITDEDLVTLIQIGEKALRGNSPAIKVIN